MGGFFLGGSNFFWNFLSQFFLGEIEIEKKVIFLNFFWGGGIFFGGSLTPFFCTNLLVRVKLGYTPNFTALGHLEVPWKFLVGWCGEVGNTNNHYHSSLSRVKLSWIESWSKIIQTSPGLTLLWLWFLPHPCGNIDINARIVSCFSGLKYFDAIVQLVFNEPNKFISDI